MACSDEQPRPLDRRAFLGTVAALGGSALLAACGGETATPDTADAPATDAPAADAPAAAPAGDELAASECAGYGDLSESDLSLRETLGYVDASPEAEKLCSNCQFKKEYEADSRCLGCTLFPGPVAPNGYCNSWFAMEGA